MSTYKTIAVWVFVFGLTVASCVFFDAAEDRLTTAENAAKDAAWQPAMEAKMEKLQ